MCRFTAFYNSLPPSLYLSNTLQQSNNIDYRFIKRVIIFFDEEEY